MALPAPPPASLPRRLVARVRGLVERIAKEHASPSRLFAACVIGAIVGSTPFFGLHLPLCIAVAALLRLNQVAVYGAANVSIPPLAPFLAFACIEVGTRILHGHGSVLRASALRGASPWTIGKDVFAAWLLGAPIVGGAIGALLGAVVFQAARARSSRRRAAADPFVFATAALRERFAAAPASLRHYVAWKVRLDPVYRAVAAEIPDRARVVEIGAGLCILPILLCELSVHRRVVAVDHDERKVRAARDAARGLPIEIEIGDVRQWSAPPADVLVIVDVLHYFDVETQRAILERAASAVRPGGLLLVRDGDGSRRSGGITRLLETIAVAIGWNRSEARPTFRPIGEVVEDLERMGFACDVLPVAGPLHPGNALVRATRK